MHALVVDDSRTMRTILTRTLVGLGFTVTTAEDGQDGLDKLAAGPSPEVVLVDWNMPVMNGIEFLTHVRRSRLYPNTALLMVTSESEQSQIVRALAAGAHEYVIKPFQPEAIADKLSMLGVL
ncbi:MAG: cheY 1 [Mycobacterium sp.]|nr:cheY 1 [Mycobacterium sp.]MCW2743620.1 cheY 1 [Mycobacterium sp.]